MENSAMLLMKSEYLESFKDVCGTNTHLVYNKTDPFLRSLMH